MLTAIDDFLIARFERFAHWTQRTAGIRATHWTQVLCVIAGLSLIPDIWSDLPWGRLVDGYLLWSFGCTFLRASRRREKIGVETTMNRKKVTDRLARLLNLCLSLMVAIARILSPSLHGWPFWILWLTMAYYFDACDDLPAAPSRLREWARGLGRAKTMDAATQEN